MPFPSSVTRRKVSPPWAISTATVEAPASMAFSISSLATEAGRSTTSPAAIRSATWGANIWMFGIVHLNFISFCRDLGSTQACPGRSWSRKIFAVEPTGSSHRKVLRTV